MQGPENLQMSSIVLSESDGQEEDTSAATRYRRSRNIGETFYEE